MNHPNMLSSKAHLGLSYYKKWKTAGLGGYFAMLLLQVLELRI